MQDGKVRGTVHLIEETKTYGQKGFRKRVVVLEQDKGRFTNYVPIEFVQDSCDAVDELNVGDEVEVSFRLNGRKWQRDANSEVKFFLNAEALSFTKSGSGGGSAPAAAESGFDESEFGGDDEDSEVPF